MMKQSVSFVTNKGQVDFIVIFLHGRQKEM